MSRQALPIIEIEHIAKSYTLAGREFWALKDIDLRVYPGEVVGILGRNGAGKTTLLRILSRITEPSRGRAVIRGRVGTLLETGVGFHEDLSGRENVYLNGAILGMRPGEIRRRFDEIVDFSGVKGFIDAPVKSYSSGMRSRLAFSVAAHLETEILLVDEVLAVGDLGFQEKCLRKMDELTRESSRTILFVSHSMGAIQSLCTRAVLIEEGRIACDGYTPEVVAAYYQLMTGAEGSGVGRPEARPGSGELRITTMRLEDLEGRPIKEVTCGAGARIIFDYRSTLSGKPAEVIVTAVVSGARGVRMFGMPSDVTRSDLTGIGEAGSFICTLPRVPLLPGAYEVTLSVLVDRRLTDKLVNVCRFQVADGDPFGTGRLQQSNFGDVWVDFAWATVPVESALPTTPT